MTVYRILLYKSRDKYSSEQLSISNWCILLLITALWTNKWSKIDQLYVFWILENDALRILWFLLISLFYFNLILIIFILNLVIFFCFQLWSIWNGLFCEGFCGLYTDYTCGFVSIQILVSYTLKWKCYKFYLKIYFCSSVQCS